MFLKLKKLKILHGGHMQQNVLMVKKLLERFMSLEFEVEEVIKRKDDKLYAKQKGYDNSFNSWIDEKKIPLYKNELLLRTWSL